MTTLRETIQAEIDQVTKEAADKVHELRTKLAAEEPTLIAVLDSDIEKVKIWFETLKAHL